MEEQAGWVLGIDFGTTYTTVAARRAGQPPEMVEVDGDLRMPSVVLADEVSGELLVGSRADDLAAAQPNRAVREAKRRVGQPAPVLLGGRAYPITTVVGALLAHARAQAEAFVGSAPARVVLTHPATWRGTRRDVLAQSAREAGIHNPTFVPEPVAAARAYAEHPDGGSGGLVAIYDLGGGTFDTAMIRGTADGSEIVGEPGGDDRIGGQLFDELVANHIGAGLPGPVWEALQADDDVSWRRAWADYRTKVRQAKEALSRGDRAELVIGHPLGQEHVVFRRDELESLIRDHLAETVEILAATVTDAGVEPGDLDAIYLVGGASRIPLVERMVAGAFPDAPLLRRGDPKMVVARGATAPLGPAAAVAPARPVVPPRPVTPPAPALVVPPTPIAVPRPAPAPPAVQPPAPPARPVDQPVPVATQGRPPAQVGTNRRWASAAYFSPVGLLVTALLLVADGVSGQGWLNLNGSLLNVFVVGGLGLVAVAARQLKPRRLAEGLFFAAMAVLFLVVGSVSLPSAHSAARLHVRSGAADLCACISVDTFTLVRLPGAVYGIAGIVALWLGWSKQRSPVTRAALFAVGGSLAWIGVGLAMVQAGVSMAATWAEFAAAPALVAAAVASRNPGG